MTPGLCNPEARKGFTTFPDCNLATGPAPVAGLFQSRAPTMAA